MSSVRDPSLPEAAVQSWSRIYDEEVRNPSPAGLGAVLPNLGPRFASQYGKASIWAGYFAFNVERRYANQVWAGYGIPSYSFFFDALTANMDKETLSVAHFQEILFVFGTMNSVGSDVDRFYQGTHGAAIKWPKYTKKNPMNVVFSVNNGTYVQPDTWRTEAMQIFLDLAKNLGKEELGRL
ncbi:hypothetical protein ACHAQH_007822 [Verticillium albo-atrum]